MPALRALRLHWAKAHAQAIADVGNLGRRATGFEDTVFTKKNAIRTLVQPMYSFHHRSVGEM